MRAIGGKGRAGAVVLLVSAMLLLLVGSALAYHYGSYSGDNTFGNVGQVVHYSDHAKAPGDQYTNDGRTHTIGQQLRYLEYYLGGWHTTGTTVGSKTHSGSEYHISKSSGPPSTCRTAKFHDDYYWGGSQTNSAEAGTFLVCP